jgi:hypothetical protein
MCRLRAELSPPAGLLLTGECGERVMLGINQILTPSMLPEYACMPWCEEALEYWGRDGTRCRLRSSLSPPMGRVITGDFGERLVVGVNVVLTASMLPAAACKPWHDEALRHWGAGGDNGLLSYFPRPGEDLTSLGSPLEHATFFHEGMLTKPNRPDRPSKTIRWAGPPGQRKLRRE